MSQVFQIVPQLSGTRRRRGVYGLTSGFGALGDDADILPGQGGIYWNSIAYTLANGHVVYLPPVWASWANNQKQAWIDASSLSPADSIQLETEAGLNSGGGGVTPLPTPTPTPAPGRAPTPTPTPRPAGSVAPGRATYDYVRGGDVVRVTLSINSAPSGSGASDFLQLIAPRLSGYNLSYINGNAGSIGSFLNVQRFSPTIDVQSKGDRNSIADVASDVYAAASSAGFVMNGQPTASFVSKVEQTGGNVRTTAPGGGGGGSFNLGGLGNVSSSNLLLLGGAGVLLLVVLAKR